MRTWCLSLIALTIALATSAASAVTVWRWVDENGVVHYSDRPVEGAEQIELSSAQSFPAVRSSPDDGSGPTSSSEQETAYRRFELVSPTQQETLWNIGGTLGVRVELEPPLQAGHRLDVFLDGERRNVASTSTQFAVPEVYRGLHTLQGIVLDESGNEVLRTLAVTFMVQQTSIQNPNNTTPPARRN